MNKLFREDPEYKPEKFDTIDLSELRFLSAKSKATEYSNFLEEALQIGVSVQTEMRKLENERFSLSRQAQKNKVNFG